MGAHSTIGASSMHRWAACPGSVALSEGAENKSSVYAAEGTVAHEIAAECLLKPDLNPRDYIGETWPQDGHDIAITDEMVDAVQVYLDYVGELIADAKTAGEPCELFVEQKLHLKDINENAFGTADCILWFPRLRLLIVIDYKHGAGVPVEVKGNPQFLYYALGEAWNLNAKTIRVGLVQPRCPHEDGPIRTDEVTGVEMLEWAGVLEDAIEATLDPNAPLVTGDHCRWCPAAAYCPEQTRMVMETAMSEFKDENGKYDPEELADLLDKIPAIKAWCAKVDEFAYGEAMHGRCPPRRKLVAKRATRKWIDTEATEKFLLDYGMSDKDIFARTMLTPPKIEKIIGTKNKGDIEDLVKKVSSGNVLVSVDDKREAVIVGAESEFEAV